MQTLLELKFWVELQHRANLFGPSDDGSLQKRDFVLTRAGPTAQVNRWHGKPRLTFDLATNNRGAAQEVVEFVHNLTGRHFTPTGLVLLVTEDRQKYLVCKQFKMFERTGATNFRANHL